MARSYSKTTGSKAIHICSYTVYQPPHYAKVTKYDIEGLQFTLYGLH